MGDTDIENARLGYQTAVHLWASQSEQLWGGFNAIVVANSIAIAAVVLLSERIGWRWGWFPVLILSIAGILFCVLWLRIIHRHFWYQDYYITQSRELEGGLAPVETVQKGKIFEEIQTFVEEKNPLKTRWQECLRSFSAFLATGTVRWFASQLIVLFMVVYLMFLVWAILECFSD